MVIRALHRMRAVFDGAISGLKYYMMTLFILLLFILFYVMVGIAHVIYRGDCEKCPLREMCHEDRCGLIDYELK